MVDSILSETRARPNSNAFPRGDLSVFCVLLQDAFDLTCSEELDFAPGDVPLTLWSHSPASLDWFPTQASEIRAPREARRLTMRLFCESGYKVAT
jgi:hypothetical protein